MMYDWMKDFTWYWYKGRNQMYRIIAEYGDVAFIVGNITDKAFCVRTYDLTKVSPGALKSSIALNSFLSS